MRLSPSAEELFNPTPPALVVNQPVLPPIKKVVYQPSAPGAGKLALLDLLVFRPFDTRPRKYRWLPTDAIAVIRSYVMPLYTFTTMTDPNKLYDTQCRKCGATSNLLIRTITTHKTLNTADLADYICKNFPVCYRSQVKIQLRERLVTLRKHGSDVWRGDEYDRPREYKIKHHIDFEEWSPFNRIPEHLKPYYSQCCEKCQLCAFGANINRINRKIRIKMAHTRTVKNLLIRRVIAESENDSIAFDHRWSSSDINDHKTYNYCHYYTRRPKGKRPKGPGFKTLRWQYPELPKRTTRYGKKRLVNDSDK